MVRNKNKNRAFGYTREIQNKTNYSKRLTLLKSGKPRVVIRKFQGSGLLQLVSFDKGQDIVKTSVYTASPAMKKLLEGVVNTNTVTGYYVAGVAFGKQVLKQNVTECIVDIGFHSFSHHGRIGAALEGIRAAGVTLLLGKGNEYKPTEERLKGAHLKVDAKKVDTLISKL